MEWTTRYFDKVFAGCLVNKCDPRNSIYSRNLLSKNMASSVHLFAETQRDAGFRPDVGGSFPLDENVIAGQCLTTHLSLI